MITNTDSIASLMDELSSKVGSDQDLYLIGGGAMMFMGSKAATKDVDLVVRGEPAYTAVRTALMDMGFKSIRPGAEYSRMNLSDMLEREDRFRIDLFDTESVADWVSPRRWRPVRRSVIPRMASDCCHAREATS